MKNMRIAGLMGGALLAVAVIAVAMLAAGVADTAANPSDGETFEPADGDSIVLIGGYQIEAHGEQGYLEAILTAAWPERALSFRNIAWTGDEVDQHDRSDPYPGILEWVDMLEPEHAFVSYGLMEAFRGEEGLEGFVEAYAELLDELERREINIVLISPAPHEHRPELPEGAGVDAAAHNRRLAAYTAAIAELAEQRGHLFINLFDVLADEAAEGGEPRLTTNGVKLDRFGYWRAAQVIAEALGVERAGWRVRVDVSGEPTLREAAGMRVRAWGEPQEHKGRFHLPPERVHHRFADAVDDEPPFVLRFEAEDERLPFPPRPPEAADEPLAEPRVLRVEGLASRDHDGDYLLRVDGEPVARASAAAWAEGVTLDRDRAFDEAERLRHLIVEKNRQFFYRYRTQNHVHVYGIRRHAHLDEEVRQFETIARRREQELRRHARPTRRTYELAPAPEPAPPLRQIERVDLARYRPAPVIAPEQVPPAEEVRESFMLADGFEANLFADLQTLAGKPIQMRFDPEGRLWVAVTQRYPQIKPGEVAADRILVLEDTTGDGRADIKRTFADHLLVPTGLQPGDGGVYVHYDTRIVHLKDTTGNGRADRQRVILGGIGTDDTHHMVHEFRFSPWGMLYFHQGVFQNTRMETPAGLVKHHAMWESAGSMEINPRTHTVRRHVARSSTANPWGHNFNRWGWAFQMGTNPPGASLLILSTAMGTSATVPLEGDDQTRPMDAEFVGGPHVPDGWQGSLLATFQRGFYLEDRRRGEEWLNRVQRWDLEDQGSGYRLIKRTPLVASEHLWFRPTQIRQGPDGAFYVADFVTPIIEHLEQHQRDPRRDRYHGRIWRIRHADRDLVDPPAFVEASSDELFQLLRSDQPSHREQAIRVLTERPSEDVIPRLRSWIAELDAEDPQYDFLRVQALWLFQAHGVVEEPLLRSVLEADHAEARAAATRVVRYQHHLLEADPHALLRDRVQDESPRVRLKAVIALSHLDTAEAMQIALLAREMPRDRFLDAALAQTREALAPRWFAAIEQGRFDLPDALSELQYLMQEDPSEAVADAIQQKIIAVAAADLDDPADLPEVTAPAGEDDEGPDLALGQQIYGASCMECHGADGQGIAGTFPPVVETDYVLEEDAERFIRIVLHGMAGPVEVRGERYVGFMPPFQHLSDEDIASVISYVRNAWTNEAPHVTAEQVRQVRDAVGPRTQPWSAEELEALD